MTKRLAVTALGKGLDLDALKNQNPNVVSLGNITNNKKNKFNTEDSSTLESNRLHVAVPTAAPVTSIPVVLELETPQEEILVTKPINNKVKKEESKA